MGITQCAFYHEAQATWCGICSKGNNTSRLNKGFCIKEYLKIMLDIVKHLLCHPMVLLLSKKPRGQCSNAPKALLYTNLIHSVILEVKTCLGCHQTTYRGKVGQNHFSIGLPFALWQKRETYLQRLVWSVVYNSQIFLCHWCQQVIKNRYVKICHWGILKQPDNVTDK